MADLKLEKAGGVARIIFDRPKHNVFNIAMMRELNAMLEQLLQDDDLKCLVLAAEGRSWSAGVDVGEHSPEMAPEMIATFNRIFELLMRFEVPTIAAVHGRALGGGMEVAIACDMILAAKSALFGQPEIKLGFLPPYAAMRLPQLVGPARAIEVCCSGMVYTAAEAHAMGMVARVVEDEAFGGELERVIKEIAYCSPLIIRLNKRAVREHLGLDFEEALAGVSSLFLDELMKTEDVLEGLASFAEKRRPVWKNK